MRKYVPLQVLLVVRLANWAFNAWAAWPFESWTPLEEVDELEAVAAAAERADDVEAAEEAAWRTGTSS